MSMAQDPMRLALNVTSLWILCLIREQVSAQPNKCLSASYVLALSSTEEENFRRKTTMIRFIAHGLQHNRYGGAFFVSAMPPPNDLTQVLVSHLKIDTTRNTDDEHVLSASSIRASLFP